MLGIVEYSHGFELEMQFLKCLDVGVPKTEYSGPDLTVIILPNVDPKLGAIKAHKRFYDISLNREQHMAEALDNDGFWVAIGNPVRLEDIEGSHHGFNYVIGSNGIGACTMVTKRHDEGDFDFLHLDVNCSGTGDTIESFGGMSGGGVWKIPLLKKTEDPPSKAYFGAEILSGVIFYEILSNNRPVELRCHGGKSVYQNAHEALTESCA